MHGARGPFRLSVGMARPTDDADGSRGAADDDNRDQRLADQAERLKKLRAATGLSQERFAAQIGAHGNSVASWENGKSEMRMEFAVEIAAFCKVPLADVLGYEPAIRERSTRERLDTLEQSLAGLATDSTVSDCFETVAKRISELRADLEPRLTTQTEVLDALLLEVRALARLVRGEALPDKDDLSKPVPRAKRDRRDQSNP